MSLIEPSNKPVQTGMSALRNPTLKENLEQQLSSAIDNVNRLREALALLEKNPEVNRLLDLLRSSNF